MEFRLLYNSNLLKFPVWFIFATMLLSSGLATAQQSLFTGLAFEHEVTPRYGYQLEIEHRQLLNTGIENRLLLQTAINLLITERFSVTPALRFTPRYDDDPGTIRLQADLNYDLPLGEGKFTLEGRFRSQYAREVGPEADGQARLAVRPRIGVAYQALEHTGLVVEYEARYRFDLRNDFSLHRVTLGLSQKISTRISAQLFYRLERAANVPDIRTEPTLGVYLAYLLPDARERDWQYRRPFGRSLLF